MGRAAPLALLLGGGRGFLDFVPVHKLVLHVVHPHPLGPGEGWWLGALCQHASLENEGWQSCLLFLLLGFCLFCSVLFVCCLWAGEFKDTRTPHQETKHLEVAEAGVTISSVPHAPVRCLREMTHRSPCLPDGPSGSGGSAAAENDRCSESGRAMARGADLTRRKEGGERPGICHESLARESASVESDGDL